LQPPSELVREVLGDCEYIGKSLNQKRLIELLMRLAHLRADYSDKYMARIERVAIMSYGGYGRLDSHIYCDTTPDMYGDIRTLDVFTRED